MAAYDYSYISSLTPDILKGDSDACSGLFAATYRDVYRRIYKRTGSEYQSVTIMRKLYMKLFSSEFIPLDGKTFIKIMYKTASKLCSEAEVVESKELSGQRLRDYSRSNSDPELTYSQAEILLYDIITSLHMQPSEFALSALVSYGEFRARKNVLQRVILVAVLCLFALCPIIFLSPNLTVEKIDELSKEWEPVYGIYFKSMIPPDSVYANIGSEFLTVTRDADGTYMVAPTKAGKMEVTVTTISHQSTTTTVDVTHVDYYPPVLEDYAVKDDKLYIYASDEDSGIDPEKCFIENPDGTIVPPISYNEETGE
ncbi:MAG: hypothetical protein HUJ73_05655, partial [Eubacterium sp.]|nr:hypothetical protein [Eubacterium sp.]